MFCVCVFVFACGAALTRGMFTWMSCAKKRAAPSWRSGLINSTNQPVTVKPSICSPMGPRGTHRRPPLQHGDEPPRRSSCDTGPTKDRSFPPSMDDGGRVTLGVHFHRYPPTVLTVKSCVHCAICVMSYYVVRDRWSRAQFVVRSWAPSSIRKNSLQQHHPVWWLIIEKVFSYRTSFLAKPPHHGW